MSISKQRWVKSLRKNRTNHGSDSDSDPDFDKSVDSCIKMLVDVPDYADLIKIRKCVESNVNVDWMEAVLENHILDLFLNILQRKRQNMDIFAQDSLLHLEAIRCIRSVANSKVGLLCMIGNGTSVRKLVKALDTTNTLVKKQIFELLSALCVYSDEGYRLALGALENYKVSKTLRYRFSVIMAELKHAEVLAYKTTILAFINCILVATKDSHKRIRLRNEFVALNLLDIINDLRNEDDEDMEVQCDVFCDEKEDDEETMGQQEQTLDINDAAALIDKINEEVRGQPEEVELLSILQSLYQASQQSVNRAMIFKSMSDAVHRLVTSPGAKHNNQNRQLLTKETQTDHSTQAGNIRIESPDVSTLDTVINNCLCHCEVTSTRGQTSRGQVADSPTPPISPEKMDMVSSVNDSSSAPIDNNNIAGPSCVYLEETVIKKQIASRLDACPPTGGMPLPPPPPSCPDLHLPEQACPGRGPPLTYPPPLCSPPFPSCPAPPPPPPPPPFPSCPAPPPPPPFPGSPAPPPPPPPFPGCAAPLPPPPPGCAPPPPPPFGTAPPPPPLFGAPPFPGSPATFSPQQPQIQTITTPKPKSKMKLINWSKVNPRLVLNQGEVTVWEEVYGTPDPVEVDYNTIEKLFCQKTITSTGTSKSEKKAPTEVNLLDAKRSMNVNIFLKQFKHTNDEIVRMIRECDLAKIGPERLQQLNKVMPEADEAELIKNYSDDKSKLGAAEKFYDTVIALPAYQLRLSAMMLKMDFEQGLESLNPDLEAILTGARSLIHSQSLIEFLRFVLHAGNFINAGSYAGNCVGFKVNSVMKLYEHRANKPRMTLLHFLVEEAESHKRDILSFAEDLNAPLTKAAKISIDQMKADFNDLKTRCEKFSLKLDNAPDDLIEQCQQFVKRAQSELDDLRVKFDEIERLRVTLAHNFCETESSFRLEDILKIFSSFSEKVLLCRKENVLRLQQEERAEKRRLDAEATKIQQEKQEVTASSNEDSCIVDMLISGIKKGNRVRKRALFAAAGDILTQGM